MDQGHREERNAGRRVACPHRGAARARGRALCSRASKIHGGLPGGKERLPRRRADALDERLADPLPDHGRQAQGRDADRHRRPCARRFLPRRHRLDVRPLAAAGRARHPPPGLARPDLHAAVARTRAPSASSWQNASACPSGRSPPPPATPTALRCAWRAPSPAGQRSSSSTAATTARSTRPSCASTMAAPPTRRDLPASSAT